MAASPFLLPLASRAAGVQAIGSTGPVTEPVGTLIHRVQLMVLQLVVTAGTGTLNVYVQHSLDGGTTWDDFISFTQIAASTGQVIAQWDRDSVSASAVHAKADGTLAAGTVINGPTGDDWRLKWTIGTGPFTFSLAARQLQRTR